MGSGKTSLLLVLSIIATLSAASEPPADPDPNRFAKEIEAFAQWDSRNAVVADPILFVGSSSIRMWRTRESFPDLPVINRGFGGSHICDVIHFTDRVVLPYKPKVVVFYAGDNDIAAGKSARKVVDEYRRWVGLVHARLPDVRLIFISIKPSGSRWSLWPEMNEANGLIRDFCRQDDRLFFADLATPLLGPDGKPRDELFLNDKLHLSSAGYRIWAGTLGPVLRQACGSNNFPPKSL